mgnify:CR=1 FL=1
MQSHTIKLHASLESSNVLDMSSNSKFNELSFRDIAISGFNNVDKNGYHFRGKEGISK